METTMTYTKEAGKYYKDNPEKVRQRSLIHNKKQMYVNGKYVRQDHPLHKPGRYTTFEDAAFSSLEKYNTSKEGQVYIITNPNFPEWIKVGMAVDAEDRLNNYQTSSPFRDYELYESWDVSDRREAESEAHKILTECADERKNEWFKCDPAYAKLMIRGTMEDFE